MEYCEQYNIYKCQVSTPDAQPKVYIGSTTDFKHRYLTHINPFNNSKYNMATLLAK